MQWTDYCFYCRNRRKNQQRRLHLSFNLKQWITRRTKKTRKFSTNSMCWKHYILCLLLLFHIVVSLFFLPRFYYLNEDAENCSSMAKRCLIKALELKGGKNAVWEMWNFWSTLMRFRFFTNRFEFFSLIFRFSKYIDTKIMVEHASWCAKRKQWRWSSIISWTHASSSRPMSAMINRGCGSPSISQMEN